jgi:DNA-binding transcriptional LysR family regulator
VGRLEARVGVRLLNRTTRQVTMTFEGEQLYVRASRLLDDLRDIESILATQRAAPVGRVRVTLPATLGRMVIIPSLPRFLATFPGIELDVGLDDRKVDLVEGGYDLSIRTGHLEDSALIARKLAPHEFVLCASPSYLATRGQPETLEDLRFHTCIRFRYPPLAVSRNGPSMARSGTGNCRRDLCSMMVRPWCWRRLPAWGWHRYLITPRVMRSMQEGLSRSCQNIVACVGTSGWCARPTAPICPASKLSAFLTEVMASIAHGDEV